MFGLEVPSSDGDVSKRVHRDPLLIELSTRRRYNEEQMRIFGPEDGCGSEEEQLQTASRIISNADLLLIAGCLSDVEFFARDIARLKERYGTTVAVFASEGATNIGQLQPDHVFADPLSVVFPQLFAMNPRSLWFDDGSLRIFYPGVTITATPNGGLSTCYADPMNAVPRHSRAFAVSCGPFVPRPALSRAEIMAISDEDIVRLCQNSPNLTDTTVTRTFPVRPVYVLAENVLVKVGGFGAAHAPEAAAMTLVRQQTSIPVPEMYRFFVHGSRSYLVMEYVHGETLDHCWDDLTSWEKIQVSVVLRDYVKQMRRIRTPQIDKQIPGPITEDLSRPIRCELPALGECRAGPFFSYAELRDWMNGRLRVSQQMQRYRYGGQAFDDSESLVFTHGDLFLRNLILGNDQRLWLIDFGCAGVYPRWFEVYGMLERTLIYPQPKLWTWTRKFAAGPYEEQERYICACQEAMTLGTLWPDPGPEELERELSSLGL
ncbi:kinase-like protein [Lentinus tigrinus ALCF2SS1-7]|uniref:kinase-like protein n=1 Tax=Lentinus tigrinus ALCF2SS1-7 TaxID=1328758 RepID=UPI001165F55C|nr:kinase-like protein [Lentinus tigrinus ALCF2SS1-7]